MPDQGDQADLERTAKAKEFLSFIQSSSPLLSREHTTQLNDALYTASELNLLKMEGSIEIGAALRIHAIVESVLAKGFPARLRM